jgi:Ca-activated chloride channel family protein
VAVKEIISRTLGASFLQLLLATILSVSTFAQDKKPTPPAEPDVDVLRVDTTLVTVPVSVMDHNGRFIPDLKQDHFHMFEDGVEQQIAFFENAEQPFTVALILDVSDSTVAQLAQIKNAAAAFISELRADDRVMVVTFDKRITILCEPTSDRQLLGTAINRAQSGGGTSLYGAVDLVVRERFKRIRGRKAIVLFTDGVDTTSQNATYESTLHTAEELDALIYTIRYNTYADVAGAEKTSVMDPVQGTTQMGTPRGESLTVAYKRGENYLKLLSDKTAGRSYDAASLDRLKEIFAKIAAELRQQYSLGFYPSNKSSTKRVRQLKVKVTEPNVVVRSRKTYLYSAPQPQP